MDAHFKESGKVDVDRDALKNFARYELQMPEESLRNLGLILPEVAFFDSSDITNLSTYSVFTSEKVNFGCPPNNDLILIMLGWSSYLDIAWCMGFENCRQRELSGHCHKFKSLVISLK